MLTWTIFSSWAQAAVIASVIFLGQFVYATTGFGAGMITISLLALLYGNVNVYVPFFLLLCLPTEIAVSIRDRQFTDFRRTGRLLLFIVPGIVGGAWILSSTPDRILLTLLGGVISGIALWFLFLEDRLHFQMSHPGWDTPVGLISGLLGGLYGVSGPPLIVYFKSQGLDKRTFRVALLSIFLAMSLVRTVSYGAIGLLPLNVIASAILTLPAAVLGTVAGMACHRRIPESPFRRLTSILLLASGILLLIRSA